MKAADWRFRSRRIRPNRRKRIGYLTEAEVKALGVLAAAGLVPPLRLSLPGDSRPGPAVLPGPRPWAERAFPEIKASLCFRDRIRPGA